MASLSGWHTAWEENVYGKGRQLNRYPYHAVVGFVFSNFGAVPDRSKIQILELGCGAGNNLWFASREGFSVAGIDGSPSAVEYARRRFADEGLTGDFQVGNFASLPWPDGNFDMVLDRESLTHTTCAVIDSALKESRRVLRTGGKLLSIIYSDKHPGRAFGRHLGDNTYADFTGGYFEGLGTAHFAPLGEIETVYGKYFSVYSLVHTIEEDCLQGRVQINAFWRISATRKE